MANISIDSHINELITRLDERVDELGTKVQVLETVAGQLNANIEKVEQGYTAQLRKLENRFWAVFMLFATESIGLLVFMLQNIIK